MIRLVTPKMLLGAAMLGGDSGRPMPTLLESKKKKKSCTFTTNWAPQKRELPEEELPLIHSTLAEGIRVK